MEELPFVTYKLEEVLPSKVLASLQNGAAEKEFVAAERKMGGSLPSSVKELYRWRNGAIREQVGFLPEFCFLSLSSANIESTSHLLPPHILPVFGNGAGEYLYLDLKEKQPSNLYFWDRDEPNKTGIVFDSLLQFFRSVVDAWASEVFCAKELKNKTTKTGFPRLLTVDFKTAGSRRIWNEIVRKYNPAAFKHCNGIAFLNTAFLLVPSEYCETEIFTEDEYLGFAESFPNTGLKRHWNEMVKRGTIETPVSKATQEEELEWLSQTAFLLSGFLSSKRSSKDELQLQRLKAQIKFLEDLHSQISKSKVLRKG